MAGSDAQTVPPSARGIAAIFRRFVAADYESVMCAANFVAADPGRSRVPPRAVGGRALVPAFSGGLATIEHRGVDTDR